MNDTAFQDQIRHNHCFGCGPHNDKGLRIKSYWEGEQRSVCRYQPEPHQTAGPRQFVNGGIIATLIDCHSICTAIAYAYRSEGREVGTDPTIWYVTGSMNIKYLKPTPIERTVDLTAQIAESGEKRTVISCTLSSAGQVCATAEVVAIRVPPEWYE